MSRRDSSSKSPEAPRASSSSNSKVDRDDAYDANIRNFAPVARIMKNALPENAKIAKEAKECMQECVSEFISFITSEGKFRATLKSPVNSSSNTFHSLGEMPSGKAQDSQRRGHLVRHDIARLRELCRGLEDLPFQVPRSEITLRRIYRQVMSEF